MAQMVSPAFRVANVDAVEPEHLDLGEITGGLEEQEGQLVEIVGDVVQLQGRLSWYEAPTMSEQGATSPITPGTAL